MTYTVDIVSEIHHKLLSDPSYTASDLTSAAAKIKQYARIHHRPPVDIMSVERIAAMLTQALQTVDAQPVTVVGLPTLPVMDTPSASEIAAAYFSKRSV